MRNIYLNNNIYFLELSQEIGQDFSKNSLEEEKKDNLTKKNQFFGENHFKKLIIDSMTIENMPGKDDDIVVWNPLVVKKVERDDICLKYQKLFVFRGYKIYGEVLVTFLRGNSVSER
jgi:hypothetical protein